MDTPFGQVPLGRGVADLQQRRGCARVGLVEAVEAGEQADQEQQPLQIQQPPIAMGLDLLAALAVEGIAHAASVGGIDDQPAYPPLLRPASAAATGCG